MQLIQHLFTAVYCMLIVSACRTLCDAEKCAILKGVRDDERYSNNVVIQKLFGDICLVYQRHLRSKACSPLVQCPASMHPRTTNGLVNKVEFFGLLPKSGNDQWEVGNYYIAFPLQQLNLFIFI